MLYVGSAAPLPEDDGGAVQALADAFEVAYARYDDFQRLDARTREVEAALADLQAAQQRLVQSEKLASLGQLTAGIAHEIKNPLNFVNNFAQLSRELAAELAPSWTATRTRRSSASYSPTSPPTPSASSSTAAGPTPSCGA